MAAVLALSVPAARAAELCDGSQPQRAGQQGRGDKPSGEHDHPPRAKWWVDPKLRAELGVTDQQSAAVEQIWQKSLPALRDAREKLDKLEQALTQMTSADTADEAAVIAQIERVENMRAEANKRRTVMIYRMNKLLTPDQRAKVKAMFERNEPQRRGGSSR